MHRTQWKHVRVHVLEVLVQPNSTRLTLLLIQQKVGHQIAHPHLGGWHIHHQHLDLGQVN